MAEIILVVREKAGSRIASNLLMFLLPMLTLVGCWALNLLLRTRARLLVVCELYKELMLSFSIEVWGITRCFGCYIHV